MADDPFADAHALEERHIASGFQEGKRCGGRIVFCLRARAQNV
jgi:hypothetical protein